MKTSIGLCSVFLLLVGTLTLSSCGNPHTDIGKKIFRYNESSGIVTLDPAFARDQAHIWVCNQLYNGLVQLNDSLQVKPSIAGRWEISPDGKTYTFHLRQDVFFHADSAFHGKKRKVSASDFVYSFQRIVNPATASPGSWVFANVAEIDGKKLFLSPDDSTFQIVLKQPFPPFLGILSMQYCSVVPQEAVAYYGTTFRKHPVGTGPFFLKHWVENIKMILQRNPDYFEKENGQSLPYLDAVSISFLIDKMTAFLEFTQGHLDFISGIAASYKDEILNRKGCLRSKYSATVNLLKGPYLNTEYLGILVDTTTVKAKLSPLKYKAVRRAIQYGFDRKKMIRFLRNGIGIPGNSGIIPAGLPSYEPHSDYGYFYAPDSSRRLLKAAGFGAGNPVPPITLNTTAAYVDLCKFIQAQLQEVGLTIRLNVLPAASMREMKANQKLKFFRASWIADYPDEENYLSLFYSKNFAPDGPNYTHFSNKKFDAMYLQSFTHRSAKKRILLYRRMDSLIMEESPVVILYYDEVLRFVRKRVHGMTINPINLLNLKRVRIGKEQ